MVKLISDEDPVNNAMTRAYLIRLVLPPLTVDIAGRQGPS